MPRVFLSVRRRPALLAIFIAALVAGGPAAAAHEGKAIITAETQADRPDGTDYTIRAVWTNDGHPAADATVTATPINPAGAAGTPIAFSARDDDGRYGGFVPMPIPGRWTVRFSIVEPTGTLEVTRDVAEVTTTTAKRVPPTTATTAAKSSSGATGNISAIFIALGLMAAVALVAWLMHRQSKKAKAS